MKKSKIEKNTQRDDSYILKLSGSRNEKIASATSTAKCEVHSYSGNELRFVFTFSETKNMASDIKFCPENDNLLYTSSSDGSIKLWDMRTGQKPVNIFEEDTATREFIKPLCSFDINREGRILCGGSELVDNDAFMLFWDVRNSSPLGGYWNSHNDDVVQVQFSKENSSKLASGGADGLVNIFDICEKSESDALQYSLNIDCAVDKVSWLSDDFISCITQNIDVQFWNTDTADQTETYFRNDIANSIQDSNVENCYLIDIYETASKIPFLLVGSYDEQKRNINLVEITDKKIVHKSTFVENDQIVRCSWYDKKNEIIIFGGESGKLNIWNQRETQVHNVKTKITNKTLSSAMQKLKVHKNKPY